VSQVKTFHQALKETGYVEGQNVAIEYRWAENQIDRLSALAGDLVRRKVSLSRRRQPSLRIGSKIDDYNNSNRLHECCRSRGDRPGCKLQPAGRKRNGRYLAQCRTRGKGLGILRDLLPSVKKLPCS